MAKSKKIIRKYRSKGRWSANIRTLTQQELQAAANQSFHGEIDLCTNPLQSDSTVSQQYTVKNIELSYEMDTQNNASVEGLVCYILYVPQGMTVTEIYPNLHPEYIMAYRFLGSPNRDDNNTNEQIGRLPIKIKTRLARRLQTGDKVILQVVGLNTGQAKIIYLNGIVRWWTKAN